MAGMSKAQAGRIGAHVSWSRTEDRAARTAPASAAFLARFEREVDPDGVLAPDERAKRALNARRAYMQRLAQSSARTRARNKNAAVSAPRAGDQSSAGGACGGRTGGGDLSTAA